MGPQGLQEEAPTRAGTSPDTIIGHGSKVLGMTFWASEALCQWVGSSPPFLVYLSDQCREVLASLDGENGTQS